MPSIPYRLLAFKDLLQRYGQVIRSAWQARTELEPPQRLPHEYAFLPAHLELQETPVSPIPRWSMRLIVLFAAIAVLWAIFGRIDVIATAMGKVIPSGKVKVIQPLQTSTVKHIMVSDGQLVKAGQLLVELDATETQAEESKMDESLTHARLVEARARILLTGLSRGVLPPFPQLEEISVERQAAEYELARSVFQTHRAKLATLDAELTKRQAELQTTQSGVSKLERVLPITQRRAADFANLVEQRFVSRHSYLEKEQERIEKEHDLETQRGRARELNAAIAATRQDRIYTEAEFRRALMDEMNQAQQQIVLLSQDRIKAHQRHALMKLTAPVAGVVQQLAIHTVGGVVTPAQPLMVIVPEEARIFVEAQLENKDVGFVKAGQRATVKVETFPYHRYGTIDGVVEHVSRDAIQDEKKGLLFNAHVSLKQSGLRVNGTLVRLAPGMAVTVDIKTGNRRVISYFLEPLLGHLKESLHER